MKQMIIRNNALTDNVLIMADTGKIFKGGYVAIIKEYYYLNSWGDELRVKKFKKETTLNNYLLKNYPNITIQ